MIILDKFDNEIKLTAYEESLLLEVKELFANKEIDSNAELFRLAFIDEVLNNYCQFCGRFVESYCYCQAKD